MAATLVPTSETTTKLRTPTRPTTHASRVNALGLGFDPVTFDEALDRVESLAAAREPALVVTANLNWAMLAARDPKLKSLTDKADLVVADGMPILWMSRFGKRHLPQRVAGADMVPALCKRAAKRGYRVFFLGADEGVGQRAADVLQARHPNLQIAGVEAPFLSKLSESEEADLIDRIRESRADILFAAFGQPKGEVWLHENLQRLGPLVAMQIGASIDFVAGRARRAPSWTHNLGLEWLYRTWCEPGRMISRYAANAWFLLTQLPRELWRRETADRSGRATNFFHGPSSGLPPMKVNRLARRAPR